MEEHFVTVLGSRIRYLEDGSGPCVVLIHGLGSQAERWADMMPRLSTYYRVIAPDLIGFGLSDKPQADYTPDYFVRFILGFLQELGIKETAMIGSSLGGQIVAESAACDGSVIRKIVLISPTGTMRVTNPTLDAYVMAAMFPQDDVIRRAYQMMTGDRKNVDEQAVRRFHESMSRPNAKMAFLSTVIGFKHWAPIPPRLRAISVPSLVVWGRKDSMIPIEFAGEYVSNLKDCRFVVMDACGHRPHVEEPSMLAGIICRFLGKKAAAGNPPVSIAS